MTEDKSERLKGKGLEKSGPFFVDMSSEADTIWFVKLKPGDICRLLHGITTYTVSHKSGYGICHLSSEDRFLYLEQEINSRNQPNDIFLFRGLKLRSISGVLVKVSE